MKLQFTRFMHIVFFVTTVLYPSLSAAEYSVTTLSLDDARSLVDKGEAAAESMKVNVCIAVVGASGVLISLDRMDKAPLGCVEAAIAKARSAALLRIKTSVNMQRVNGDNPAISALPFVMPLGGGVPIISGDQTIGGVGVSGATNEIEIKIAEKMAASYGTSTRSAN